MSNVIGPGTIVKRICNYELEAEIKQSIHDKTTIKLEKPTDRNPTKDKPKAGERENDMATFESFS